MTEDDYEELAEELMQAKWEVDVAEDDFLLTSSLFHAQKLQEARVAKKALVQRVSVALTLQAFRASQ